MDKPFKFVLPPPNFNKNAEDACKLKPHYLTPSGMSLLPREKQPPPMYGRQGATIPAKYLKRHVVDQPHFVSADTIYPPEKQYCEPCEMELHSLEELKVHRLQHEKCPVAGCLYKGHPSAMDKHINALHASGLFDKFQKLSTPEEIAAWREERRKRYPTLANITLKQKAREQRQKRGERLEVNRTRFGKVNDRKRAQPNSQEDKGNADEKKPRDENKTNRKNKKNRKSKNNRRSKNQEFKPKVQNVVQQSQEITGEADDLSCAGIRMFRGTCQLKNYEHFNEKKKGATNNKLFGLVGMYGSDDESEETDSDNDADNVEKIEDKYTAIIETDHEIQQSFVSNNRNEVYNFAMVNEFEFSKPPENIEQVPLIDNTLYSINHERAISNENGNSSDEAPEEVPIQRNVPYLPIKSEIDTKNISVEEAKPKLAKLTITKQKQNIRRKFGLDYRKARLRKQNTMLEKLLESDIRHERNVLLQCVRYVCENDFFNIGRNKKLEISEENKS